MGRIGACDVSEHLEFVIGNIQRSCICQGMQGDRQRGEKSPAQELVAVGCEI